MWCPATKARPRNDLVHRPVLNVLDPLFALRPSSCGPGDRTISTITQKSLSLGFELIPLAFACPLPTHPQANWGSILHCAPSAPSRCGLFTCCSEIEWVIQRSGNRIFTMEAQSHGATFYFL